MRTIPERSEDWMENSLTRLGRRIALLFRLRMHDRGMDEEMRFHMEMEARELMRNGYSPEAAVRAAHLRFGGLERHKEAGRDARGVRIIEDLANDLRYAWRQALRDRSFTFVAILTLGTSIGAATFMYSFATLDPIPFSGADRLVYIRQVSSTKCGNCQQIAPGNALVMAASTQTLQSLVLADAPVEAAFRPTDGSSVTRSTTVRASAVGPGFFGLLGVRPLVGRAFLPSDATAVAIRVVMLSEAMWRARFAADPDIVGRAIMLDGQRYIIRGVIAQSDIYPERTDVWTVRTLTVADVNDHRADGRMLAMARLRDGATLEQAQAEADAVSRRLARDYPGDMRDWTLDVRPLRLFGRGNEEDKTLFSLAAGFLMLVACTNLTGVVIARLTRRRRELAVRAAMGASPSRLTRQLMTETLLVCLVSGLIAPVPAAFGLRLLRDVVPAWATPPGFTRLAVDWRAIAFALLLAVACGLTMTVLPAIRFARPQVNDELRDGTRSRAKRGANPGERLRRALVICELALAVVLLTAAGLLLRTEARLAAAPLGLSTDHVLTVAVRLPPEIDGTRVETRGYFEHLTNELLSAPGVASAGATSTLPLSGGGWSSTTVQLPGRETRRGSNDVRLQFVTPGYFTVFGISLIAGRGFSSADADTGRRVVLVNETLSRRLFTGDGLPNAQPLGKSLVLPDGERVSIIGVVADVKQRGAMTPPDPEMLRPAGAASRAMTVVVRTRGEPAARSAAIVDAISRFDPNLAIGPVRTMDAVVAEFLMPAHVGEVAMEVFACIALIIAVMGLYGIVSFVVASRTREFGIRLALGARRLSLLRLVVNFGMGLAAWGLVIGIGSALAVTRLMQWRLYQIAPSDPLTIGAVSVGIVLVAVAAALIPARHAIAVDPVLSLRAE